MYERNPHTKCRRDKSPYKMYERNPHTKCMRPSILYGKMKVGGALPSAILPFYTFASQTRARPELLEVEVLQYFFPPAPGVVRIYFVWEVRPYWAAFGLSHTNCMGFSAIRFVWPNICIFPKVDRGWQNYFDY